MQILPRIGEHPTRARPEFANQRVQAAAAPEATVRARPTTHRAQVIELSHCATGSTLLSRSAECRVCLDAAVLNARRPVHRNGRGHRRSVGGLGQCRAEPAAGTHAAVAAAAGAEFLIVLPADRDSTAPSAEPAQPSSDRARLDAVPSSSLAARSRSEVALIVPPRGCRLRLAARAPSSWRCPMPLHVSWG